MKIHKIFQKLMLFGQSAIHSVFFFPAILTFVFILLVTFSINGSSIGIYHDIFYGNTKDSNLLFNHPQAIRSDEWLVGTQKTIAQSNNDFEIVNKNIGDGENESVLVNNPTKDWSVAFRPENIAFFVLPFDNAFSLRWWLPIYLLALAVYLFSLVFLPGKRLLSSILALAFVFSPFMQWWGAYMPAAWLLLGFVVFTKFFHTANRIHAVLWGGLLSYMAVCFAFILYPPFQIPATIAVMALALGYSIDNFSKRPRKELLVKLSILIIAVISAIAIVLLFMETRKSIIEVIQNTAYPGHRVVTSGGYSKASLFTGQLGGLLQDNNRALHFPLAGNQSEAATFILISPFIIAPLVFLMYRRVRRERKRISYMVVFPALTGMLFLAWLFVPGIDLIGKLTLLNLVPHQRLIYGVGILDLILLILFIKFYSESKWKIDRKTAIIYSLLVLIFLLCVSFYVLARSPAFISFRWAIALAIPLAVVVYLLLRKRYVLSIIVFCLFSFLSTNQIHPLYVGTSVARESPISKAMIETAKTNPGKKWVTDDIYIENFATMNGLPSLSGTYIHPQLSIWSRLAPKTDQSIYNRYAHVLFFFDRNASQDIATKIGLASADQFIVETEPCSDKLVKLGVGFIVTTNPIASNEGSCLKLHRTIPLATRTYYIYSIDEYSAS